MLDPGADWQTSYGRTTDPSATQSQMGLKRGRRSVAHFPHSCPWILRMHGASHGRRVPVRPAVALVGNRLSSIRQGCAS